ncbi:hypothetical protein CPB86DRAFT_267544 [Serendipita vermifera]|nr:hypothetical protein CPB86DRAFT_267544 [Serendipita vermifera]
MNTDYPFENHDKAVETRKKNAHAQKLYRRRKKSEEVAMRQELHFLRTKVKALQREVAEYRASSSAQVNATPLGDTSSFLSAPISPVSIPCRDSDAHVFDSGSPDMPRYICQNPKPGLNENSIENLYNAWSSYPYTINHCLIPTQ